MMSPIEDYPDDKLLISDELPEEILSEIKCMVSYNPEKLP